MLKHTNEITEMHISLFQVGDLVPVKECIFRNSILSEILAIFDDYVIFSISTIYYSENPYAEDIVLKVYKNEIETRVENDHMFYYFNDYNLIKWKRTS